MEFLLSLIILLILLMLIVPIGVTTGKITGGLVYWSENEKRKYEENETD